MTAALQDASPSSGAALRRLAEGELLQAIDCLRRKAGHLHKGVHLARKSIRRVRSLLALAGPVLGPGAEALNQYLSGINQSLSSLRDAQALVEAIDHFSARNRNEKWLAVLGRARNSAVQARMEALKAQRALDPGFEQVQGLLIQTAAALLELPWDELDEVALKAAFARSRKKTRKASLSAVATEDDEDWHRWRRKARRQTQQHRLLAEVGIRTTVRHDDKAMAELLGQQQDCALLLAFCESESSPFGWADRNQLKQFARKQLHVIRKRLARQADHG